MNRDKVLAGRDEDLKADFGFGLPLPLPAYRTGVSGEWQLRRSPGGIGSAYLAETAVNPPYEILSADGNPWMSTDICELESQAWHVSRCRGTVVCGGLGLGVFAHAAALRPEVERVVVVEKDPRVVTLLAEVAGYPWSPKILTVSGDVLDEATAEEILRLCPGGIDYLYLDIWDHFPARSAPSEMALAGKLYRPREAGWWGQELEIALWCQRFERALDASSTDRFFRTLGLAAPDNAVYPAFCRQAAEANGIPLPEPRLGDEKDARIAALAEALKPFADASDIAHELGLPDHAPAFRPEIDAILQAPSDPTRPSVPIRKAPVSALHAAREALLREGHKAAHSAAREAVGRLDLKPHPRIAAMLAERAKAARSADPDSTLEEKAVTLAGRLQRLRPEDLRKEGITREQFYAREILTVLQDAFPADEPDGPSP